ncbi:MAG: hypothetical protein ACREFF_10715 [Candidatus Udaeobacter sp.]|jgi:hypothetical protein
MADPESLRRIAHSPAPFSTWLGIVLLFVLFGVIVLAVVGPSQRGSDYEETRAKKRIENLKKLREETEKDLTAYAWVDKNKGVARIPISRAMELTVAELAQRKPAAAGPIATPPTQASPAVAPSASGVSGSPVSAGSPQPGATQPAVSASPAAQSSPPISASPAPAKTP